MAIVPIPGQPGESIDKAIVREVQWIIDKYKVKITDGYARSGHSASGEHPLGRALDIIPDFRRGGTWADVDRLARDAGWKPNAPMPKDGAFRWIGWNTEANHGKGDHLHLSWKPKGSIQDTAVGKGKSKDGGLISGVPDPGDVAEAVGVDVPGAEDIAGAVVKRVFKAFGDDGARILLYVGFVGGGAALTMIGVARMMGVKPSTVAGVAAAAATRNPKAAAAAGGAA